MEFRQTRQYKTTLLMSEFVTHDVKRFLITRPSQFQFEPGQNIELSIDYPQWRDQSHPFTLTNLDDDKILELTIKQYPDRNGLTRYLHQLKPGASLILSDPEGTISYRGPGIFLAAGTGITPFIAILRKLSLENDFSGIKLFYSNKFQKDILFEKELRHYLGENCLLICTRETGSTIETRRIDSDFINDKIKDFNQPFYVCGPTAFVKSLKAVLIEKAIDKRDLVF